MPSAGVTSPRPGPGAPWRLVFGLLAGVAFAALLAALLAPWLHLLVESMAPGRIPFQRLFRRVAMAVGLIVLVVAVRRAGVRRWADVGLGYGESHRRALIQGAAWGVAAMVALFAAELALGARAVTPERLTPGRVGTAVVIAGAVGMVEEGVLRGALLFPFGPMAGTGFVAANVAVSSLYATVHFARGGGPGGPVDGWSGLRLWRNLPPVVWIYREAWIGLFLSGALLYLLAALQGHAWGAVGLHAGSVFAVQILGRVTSPVAGRDSHLLVDGLLPGWGLSLLFAAGLAALVVVARRHST